MRRGNFCSSFTVSFRERNWAGEILADFYILFKVGKFGRGNLAFSFTELFRVGKFWRENFAFRFTVRFFLGYFYLGKERVKMVA